MPEASLDRRTALPGNPIMSGGLSANWLVAYTSARHEKRVAEQFRIRQLDSFLPLYHAVHRWKNGCQVRLELPLFPNYIFVRAMAPQYVPLLQTPGVLSIVRCGRELATVPASLIESLRAALSCRGVEPHPYLVVGHRVRVTAGPLCGLEGILLRKKSDLRIVLSLAHIMQSAAVEISAEEVEDLGPQPCPPPAIFLSQS